MRELSHSQKVDGYKISGFNNICIESCFSSNVLNICIEHQMLRSVTLDLISDQMRAE